MRKTGVGLRVVGRPIVRFVEPEITSVFNPEHNPYDENGRLLARFDPEGFADPRWAGRYLGGRTDRDAAISRPYIGAENEYMVGNRILLKAFELGRPSFGDLPFEWIGQPAEYTGVPTDQERIDFNAIAEPTADFCKKMYAASTFDEGPGIINPGTKPESPLTFTTGVRFPQARRFDGSYYRFFTDKGVGGFGAGRDHIVYVKHLTSGDGPTDDVYGYSPDYPPVFGPDLKPTTAARPPVPPVEPPKPGAAETALAGIRTAAGKAAEKLEAIKPPAKGKPAQILRDLLKKISELAPAALLLCCLAVLAGCGSSGVFRTLFTGVTSADLEFAAVKSGPTVSIVASVDERAGQAVSILSALGLVEGSDLLGVLMPVTKIGEASPVWIVCQSGKEAQKCNAIPLQAKVKFSGQPVGVTGLLWKPSRLTAEGVND